VGSPASRVVSSVISADGIAQSAMEIIRRLHKTHNDLLSTLQNARIARVPKYALIQGSMTSDTTLRLGGIAQFDRM
jgi:hypothetical protein